MVTAPLSRLLVSLAKSGKSLNGRAQMSDLNVRLATESDVPTLLHLIKQLADYEKLSHAVVATENDLRRTLFGTRPVAEALMGSRMQNLSRLPSFSTTTRPFWHGRGFTLKICL